jgi:hypothetical protein
LASISQRIGELFYAYQDRWSLLPVKLRRTRNEHISSGFAPKADVRAERAASGHAAAAPLRSATNSRRLTANCLPCFGPKG